MFLGSLLGPRRSAIGQFFSFSPSNIPRSLCESKSTQFLSRFLSGESPQPPCDKKRPLQRKGHAEWRLPLKVITTKKIQNIHQVNQARLIHKSICRLIAIYNKFFYFYIGYLKLFMFIKVFFLINANIHLISCVPAFRDVQNTIDKFWRRLSIPNNQRPREKESIRSRALTQALSYLRKYYPVPKTFVFVHSSWRQRLI